jgi:arylsulfatase A
LETGQVELYDLGRDSGETRDLSEAEGERAAALQSELAEWRKRVGARMPVPNPAYDADRADELARGPRPR